MTGHERNSANAQPHDSRRHDASIEATIVIKTLNEEANIARAIESALSALQGLRGEVIVADSLSSDHTVEIAANYPVTVVQLSNPGDRRCGAGPQLGFQYARGEFVYILDGDMELDGAFLRQAIGYMREHPDVSGIAGIVEELGGGNYEFEARKSQNPDWAISGEQRWLDMGGLYRRSALNAVGYFSNRNLHACEEQDLGLRLGSLGTRLVRLPIHSVRHYGRREDSWTLMKRRLASRYSDGPGELARATLGTPVFFAALGTHIKLAIMAGVWAGLAVGLILLPWTPWPVASAALVLIALAALMLAKKRSVAETALGLLNWQLRTAGFVRGLLTPQVPPQTWLESKTIACAPDAKA